MNYPKVCIIILNWNGLKDTVECLESLKKITYPNYEVIVVDNGSEGDDVTILREKFGDYLHIIENDKNYGFAEGNNIGMKYALSSSAPVYLLLLNNDMVVAPDFLDELVRVAESEAEIGIVGPKIYYYDFEGRNDVIWCAGGEIRWCRPWIYRGIGWNDDDLPQYQGIASVEWVSGAAMMLKSSIIGGLSFLNSQYFFGNEDVEYCLRARKHGFKIVYVPAARAWHKVGASSDMLRYSKKHEPGPANLHSYYRFIKRNFSPPVYVYHLLLLPILLLQWGISYLVKRRDKATLVEFFRSLLPEQQRP
jgi:GT2 family glycosyltransferase